MQGRGHNTSYLGLAERWPSAIRREEAFTSSTVTEAHKGTSVLTTSEIGKGRAYGSKPSSELGETKYLGTSSEFRQRLLVGVLVLLFLTKIRVGLLIDILETSVSLLRRRRLQPPQMAVRDSPRRPTRPRSCNDFSHDREKISKNRDSIVEPRTSR